jgi:hypothetical protein
MRMPASVARAFGWPLHSLAGGDVFPAVIHAAQLLAFDPAGVQPRPAMRKPVGDQVLAQQAHRSGGAGRDGLRQRDGVPELAQQFAHRGVRRRFDQTHHPIVCFSP